VARNSQGLFLSQRKYASKIVEQCGLSGAKLAEFRMETSHKLSLITSKRLDDST